MKKSFAERVFDTANALFMLVMLLVTLYPILYVLFASLSDSNKLLAHNGLLLRPLGLQMGAYKEVFANPMVLLGFGNSVFYVVAGTFLSVLVTTLGAFALSRKRLWIKKYINILVVITMFFSGGLIPTFLIVRNVGLYDTRLALMLPSLISTYNLIVLRTAFYAYPDSLEEAATIVGATDFQILFKLVIPLTKATMAVILLFYAVTRWNDWFQAAIYLRQRAKYPLQLYLREVLINSNTESMMSGASAGQDTLAMSESIKYATVMVSTLPILIVYPFLQKYFVKGVMIGAVKG